MRTKVCFSKVSDSFSKLSFVKGASDVAVEIAKAYRDDMVRAAQGGYGIYYSNALCQLADSLSRRYCVANLDSLVAAAFSAACECTTKSEMLAVFGYKDFEGNHAVAVVSDGEVVLNASDFSQAHVALGFGGDSFRISFVPVSGILGYIGELESSCAVFVVGSVPEYSSAESDLKSVFGSVSKELALSVFFAQERSFLNVDCDVFDEIRIALNYYDAGCDCRGIIDSDCIRYQKKLLTNCLISDEACGCHEDGCGEDGCDGDCDCGSCSDPLSVSECDLLDSGFESEYEEDSGSFPLCLMEGREGLLRAFGSAAINLANKARMIGSSKFVLGLSGGVDSAAALLMCVEAAKLLEWSSKDIICVSMPCFGSSRETQDNARLLAERYETTFMRIPIGDTVLSHFRDIGHNASICDKTFENAQARMRSVVLFDLANKHCGLQVGTGDLSEAVLGWCTFQGDQAAMFNANIAFSKTQLKEILRYYAKRDGSDVISSILDTPISPELLPLSDKGEILQRSEDSVGPYEVVDCFIYYYFCKGCDLASSAALVARDFSERFSQDDIQKWCASAERSYYASSFKRLTSMPGPMVTKISRIMRKLVENSAFPL